MVAGKAPRMLAYLGAAAPKCDPARPTWRLDGVLFHTSAQLNDAQAAHSIRIHAPCRTSVALREQAGHFNHHSVPSPPGCASPAISLERDIMSFSRKAAFRRISPILLAALAGAGAVAWQAPAAAQGKKTEKPAKANYSKGFVAAYKPVETLAAAPAPDYAAIKAAIPGVVTAAETPDDKMAAGRLLFSVGQKSKDNAAMIQGADLVIASGKADATALGQFNMVAAQLSFNDGQYAKARTYLEGAMAAGYTDNDPELLLAETYFGEKQYPTGLKFLADKVAARKAAGQPVPEAWVKRGLAVAYNNKLNAEANRWALDYARDYPSQTSWGDAISIAINNGKYQPAEMLDLLRLARVTNTIRTGGLYLEYVDAADPRKLPAEVNAVLAAGLAAKMIDGNQQFIKDARDTADKRIAADKAELPKMVAEANAPGASLVTIMATADTLLSYSRWAEAETLYAKAATMPGANVPLALTRQGIAQVQQGKHAKAQATFAKVTGVRQPIADLWALYAAQKTSPASATVTG